jgi:hypothetical protein
MTNSSVRAKDIIQNFINAVIKVEKLPTNTTTHPETSVENF